MRKLVPLLMALWLLPALLYAQKSSRQSRAALEQRKQQLQKEIEEATRSLQATKKSTRQNIGLQRQLEAKIATRNEQINTINTELSEIEGDISNTNDNVRTLEKTVDSLRARYAQLVVYTYKTRTSFDVLNFVFTANSFNDALRRFQYLRQYRENRRRQAENLLSTKELLGQKLAALEQQRARKAGVLHNEQQQKIALLADKKETDQTIKQLQDKEKELQQNIAKSKAEARQVDNAIQEAIRREIEAARRKAAAEALARKRAIAARKKKEKAEKMRKAEAARKAALAAAKKAGKKVKPIPPPVKEKEAPEDDEDDTPVATNTSSEDVLAASPEALSLSRDFEANRGRLPWPVDAGRVTAHFGTGMIGKVEVDHNGVIFATSRGAAVKAIFDGEVIMVFMIQGAGYMVTLRHGKYFTNYVRLLDLRVKKGMNVKRGQVLGAAAPATSGGNGEIELQIYRNMTKQNPERWIRSR